MASGTFPVTNRRSAKRPGAPSPMAALEFSRYFTRASTEKFARQRIRSTPLQSIEWTPISLDVPSLAVADWKFSVFVSPPALRTPAMLNAPSACRTMMLEIQRRRISSGGPNTGDAQCAHRYCSVELCSKFSVFVSPAMPVPRRTMLLETRK